MNFIKFYCKNYHNSTGARSLVAGGKNDALPPGTQEKVYPVKTGDLQLPGTPARRCGRARRQGAACLTPGRSESTNRPQNEQVQAAEPP